MGLKEWKEKRKARKRMDLLSEDEKEELTLAEKNSYFNVAKKQVTLRGKINAYRDFPVENPDNIKLDEEEGDKPKKEVEEIEELDEYELKTVDENLVNPNPIPTKEYNRF